MNFLLAISLLVALTASVQANEQTSSSIDTQKRQEELAKNIEQISQQFQKQIKEISSDITTAIPIITNNVSQMMQTLTGEMMPVMAALERNKQLLEANDTMAHSIKNALSLEYQKNIDYDINTSTNELSINSHYRNGDESFDFNISRNLAATFITQMIIEDTNRIEEYNFYNPDKPPLKASRTITDLQNKKLNLSEFKLNNFNENIFVCYDNNETKETFIFGNIGPLINIRVQTSGPNHSQKARDFILSIDKAKIKQAVGISENNKKTIHEYQKEIKQDAKSPKKMAPLLLQHQK